MKFLCMDIVKAVVQNSYSSEDNVHIDMKIISFEVVTRYLTSLSSANI